MIIFDETPRELNVDERLDIRTVFTSWTGIVITVISALVSILASTLVILLICISQKKLARSVYHRILFGMSVADIIQSLGMALTTLPMPTDMMYTGFQGLVIGNQFTCKAQGFFIGFAAVCGMMYNAMLAIYYLCSIQYSMTDDDFCRCLEPTLHAIVLVISLVVSTLLLVHNLYNPSPIGLAWCGVSTYPYWSKDEIGQKVGMLSLVILMACFATIIISMIMIVRNVRKRDQQRIGELSNANQATDDDGDYSRKNRILQNTKIVKNQAIAYSVVNLFGFIVMVVIPYTRTISKNGIPAAGWQIAYLVLRPLQGLFNSSIFVYHKAYSLQREYAGLTMIGAIAAVLWGDETEERVISDILEVRRHSALYQVRFAHDSKEHESSESSTGKDHSKQNTIHEKEDKMDVGSHMNLVSVNESGFGGSIGYLSGFEGSLRDLSGFSQVEEPTLHS